MKITAFKRSRPVATPQHKYLAETLVEEDVVGVLVGDEAALLDKSDERLGGHQHLVERLVRLVTGLQET